MPATPTYDQLRDAETRIEVLEKQAGHERARPYALRLLSIPTTRCEEGAENSTDLSGD